MAQVQSVAVPGTVLEPHNPAGSLPVEDFEDTNSRSIKCDSKLHHLSSTKNENRQSDETKIAKSPAMSRLLALDSENYMLRKGTGSGSTSTTPSMSITTTSNIVTGQQQRDSPRGFTINASKLPATENVTYCKADISIVQVSAVTGNSNPPNNLEKSVNVYESPENGYDEAIQSIRSPLDSSAPGNIVDRIVLTKGGATLAQRRTSNQSQIAYSNATNNVSLAISSSTSSSIPSYPSYSSKQLSPGKLFESALSSVLGHKAQDEQSQLVGFQLQPDRLDLSTGESSTIDFVNEDVVSCARPLSFHRHMCWCSSQVPVSKNSFGDDETTEVEIEHLKVTINNNNNSSSNNNNNVKSNLTGHEATRKNSNNFLVVAGVIKSKDISGKAIDDRVVNHVNSYRSLCCCMCGSLCPTECHACFHVVCSEYSGQHLCQWSSKGHALPGQVFDKEKVSLHDVRSYLLYRSLFLLSRFPTRATYFFTHLHFTSHIPRTLYAFNKSRELNK